MTSPNADDVQKQVKQLREWINTQTHLPKDVEDRFLLRFLHSCGYNFEKTKVAYDLFFTIRSSSPEILGNRDPESVQMQKTLSIVNIAQVPISKNRNLWIWQLNDPGLEHFDYVQDVKLFFLATDAWLLDDDNLEEQDIVILDVKDLSLKFITKFNVSIARKLSKYQQEALPIRLRQIHLVNAPPFIDKLFGLLKPFLKQDVTDVVHFHSPKSDTLHKYFDKADLPKDYGGTLPDMNEYMKISCDLLKKTRDKLINEKLWAAIDTKSKKKGDVPNEVGTFRSLAID